MEADLFLGSYEILHVACREAGYDENSLVGIECVTARVGWNEEEVRLALTHLDSAGMLRWDDTEGGSRLWFRLTPRALAIFRP